MRLFGINLDISIDSSMALFGAIGLISYLLGTLMKSGGIAAGGQIAGLGFVIFSICFSIIVAFALVSLARNLDSM